MSVSYDIVSPAPPPIVPAVDRADLERVRAPGDATDAAAAEVGVDTAAAAGSGADAAVERVSGVAEPVDAVAAAGWGCS